MVHNVLGIRLNPTLLRKNCKFPDLLAIIVHVEQDVVESGGGVHSAAQLIVSAPPKVINPNESRQASDSHLY